MDSSEMLIEQPIIRVYYSSQEAAAFIGISSRMLRYWVMYFGLKVAKGKSGRYKYTMSDIYFLREISHLLNVEGYTYPGVKSKLNRPLN